MKSRPSSSLIYKDPFRLFFPIGVLAGVVGISIWFPSIWDPSVYPLVLHKLMMVDGFLFSFVAGFLMTAIPRFTKTDYAKPWELWSVCSLLIASMIALGFAYIQYHYLLTGSACLFLILFAIRRFMRRADNPPFTFLFVGVSLLLWIGSFFALGLAEMAWLELDLWNRFWNQIHNEGAVLGLIVGVGGRLIPGILGWEEIVSEQRQIYERPLPFYKIVPFSIYILAITFFGSYVASIYNENIGFGLRALVIFYVGIRFWRAFHLPPKRTRLSLGIFVAIWCLLLASVLPLIWPYAYSHSAHGYFISGFSLLTLLIATRVTLAHSGSGFELESRSLMIPILVTCMVLAAFTRVTAIIWPGIYLSHLGYASAMWVIGVFVWAMVLFSKLRRSRACH